MTEAAITMPRRDSRPLPPHWRRLRLRIFERDGYRCQLCGKHGHLECDHIVAREDGGDDRPDNLRTLCRSCHIERTAASNGAPPVLPEQREWADFASRRGRRRWR